MSQSVSQKCHEGYKKCQKLTSVKKVTKCVTNKCVRKCQKLHKSVTKSVWKCHKSFTKKCQSVSVTKWQVSRSVKVSRRESICVKSVAKVWQSDKVSKSVTKVRQKCQKMSKSVKSHRKCNKKCQKCHRSATKCGSKVSHKCRQSVTKCVTRVSQMVSHKVSLPNSATQSVTVTNSASQSVSVTKSVRFQILSSFFAYTLMLKCRISEYFESPENAISLQNIWYNLLFQTFRFLLKSRTMFYYNYVI